VSYRDDSAALQARTEALEARVRELESVLQDRDRELRVLRRRELRATPTDLRAPLRWSSVEVLLRAFERRRWYLLVLVAATIGLPLASGGNTRVASATFFLGVAAIAMATYLVVFRCPACRRALTASSFVLFKKTRECPLCSVRFEE